MPPRVLLVDQRVLRSAYTIGPNVIPSSLEELRFPIILSSGATLAFSLVFSLISIASSQDSIPGKAFIPLLCHLKITVDRSSSSAVRCISYCIALVMEISVILYADPMLTNILDAPLYISSPSAREESRYLPMAWFFQRSYISETSDTSGKKKLYFVVRMARKDGVTFCFRFIEIVKIWCELLFLLSYYIWSMLKRESIGG